jgi:DNA-binding YbaB/EbfC family protein
MESIKHKGYNIMSNFFKMKKQAQLMQEKILKIKEELKNKIIEGKAANGLVVVTINGEKEIKKIKIDPSCVNPEDVEGLEDLIIIAIKDAHEKLNNESENNLSINDLLNF